MRDFTLKKYAGIVEAALERNLSVMGIRTWIQDAPAEGIFVRHDVDRRPSNALAMASLESEFGVNTTYYFRILKCSFVPETICRIHEMGHEIGYHYEDLSLADGEPERAFALFKEHLEKLRRIAPVDTIAMHGSPFRPYLNTDLWKSCDYSECAVKDAFLDIDYTDVLYLTDAGRTWADTAANLRDRVNSDVIPEGIVSSSDIVQFIKRAPNVRLSLVAHPERWDDNWFRWGTQLTKDSMANTAKLLFSALRGPDQYSST